MSARNLPPRLIASIIMGMFGLSFMNSSHAMNHEMPKSHQKSPVNSMNLHPVWLPPTKDTSYGDDDINGIVRNALGEQSPSHPNLPPPFVPEQSYDRTIELVFAVDTTGSMGGLIDGAKQKIWRIINDVTLRQKASNQKVLVRVGLVAYRDVGDRYITRVTPLSSDLDAVYSKLMAFRAEGGGDEPEHVRMAMTDALNAAGWSARSEKNESYGSIKDIGRLSQVLFLVGDAPPHEDYTQYPSAQKTAEDAKRLGIIVNTIQVGHIQATTPVWREIARKGGGDYFAIASNGGVQTISTPYDKRLAELGDDLSNRGVYYGAERERVASNASGYSNSLSDAPVGARADRAINKYINTEAAYHSSDLVQAIENKVLDLSKVREEELPSNMQKMSPSERQVYVQKQINERSKIRQEISELSKKRDQYLREQGEHDKKADAFDFAVEKALRSQIK